MWTICFLFSWCVLDQWVCCLEVDSLGANVTSKRLLGLAWAYTRHQWPETWNAVKSAFSRPKPNWRQFQTLLETHIASCKSSRLPFCNGNFRTHVKFWLHSSLILRWMCKLMPLQKHPTHLSRKIQEDACNQSQDWKQVEEYQVFASWKHLTQFVNQTAVSQTIRHCLSFVILYVF